MRPMSYSRRVWVCNATEVQGAHLLQIALVGVGNAGSCQMRVSQFACLVAAWAPRPNCDGIGERHISNHRNLANNLPVGNGPHSFDCGRVPVLCAHRPTWYPEQPLLQRATTHLHWSIAQMGKHAPPYTRSPAVTPLHAFVPLGLGSGARFAGPARGCKTPRGVCVCLVHFLGTHFVAMLPSRAGQPRDIGSLPNRVGCPMSCNPRCCSPAWPTRGR